jgi:RNA polymerase sigma-70 factor (ECF subfamily)
MSDANASDGLHDRLRAGQVDALARAFAEHRRRLWRIARFGLPRRLSGRVDVDDVLQEAYLAACKRIDRYAADGFASPFLWLRLIVQQTLVDVYRRHLGAGARDAGREVSLVAGSARATSASMAIQLVGDWTSPSQAAARGELFERVAAAIEGMSQIDRDILALRHFEELTNAESAGVLGIAPKAASIRYVRALGRLKAVLADLPGRPEGMGGD